MNIQHLFRGKQTNQKVTLTSRVQERERKNNVCVCEGEGTYNFEMKCSFKNRNKIKQTTETFWNKILESK